MTKQGQERLLETLTDRENEVLQLMSMGHTNREISEMLVVEVETVRWYTKQIYRKLSVHSRTQAILRAQELNLFEPESPRPTSTNANTADIFDNLPNYESKFVGRLRQVEEIMDALNEDTNRIISLTGPGGVGKTRLAVEVASRSLESFPDGVYFIPLVTLQSAENIALTVQSALKLRDSSTDHLIEFLREKHCLLIFDNFEHVLDGAEFIRQIVDETDRLKVLVTSRWSLNLRHEWVRTIGGIDTKADRTNVDQSESDAVQLFMECVWRVRGDFSLEDNLSCVQKICHLLDGVPLAIELATSWMKVLSCEEIIKEIESNLDFLSARHQDIEERHRSIRAVFDHSWDLLNDYEQRIAHKLSVFRGGFGQVAARQASGATLIEIADLVDKSIIQRDQSGMLFMHELLRQYVEEKFTAHKPDTMGAKTGMMLAWRSLVQGKFERAFELADSLVNAEEDLTPVNHAMALSLLGIVAGVEEDYERGLQLAEACINVLDENEAYTDSIVLMLSYLCFAISCCGVQRYREARMSTIAGLQIATDLKIPSFITLYLPIVSILLAYDADTEQAVRILSLAYSHPASTPNWMKQWSLLTTLDTGFRKELGKDAYENAKAVGHSLDLDTLVDYLLTELPANDA